jgi:hypothetical protein
MSYEESEREGQHPTRRRRKVTWDDTAPGLLIGVAVMALLALVVASALGWIF